VNVSALSELRQHSDVSSLKSALHQLCSEFGRITRLDILTAMHEGTKQAICFLRMEHPEQEKQLMKTLGVGRFGGEVVFVLNLNVPVTAEDPGPSSQWADSNLYE
jgi:endonuclease III